MNKVVLPDPTKSFNPWTRGLLKCLYNLGSYDLAEVSQGDNYRVEYSAPGVLLPRRETGAIILVNDKKVYLDCWDFARPTSEVLRNNLDGIDLIIKKQI